MERATIDPLHDNIPLATMPTFYAAAAAPKTTTAFKTAYGITRAKDSIPYHIAADHPR